MKLAYKHYQRVPVEYLANVRYRRMVVEKASKDKAFKKNIIRMCEEDPLFYIYTFVWTYNPKNEGTYLPIRVPFLRWEYQEEAFKEVFAALGEDDMIVEKSRDMGASWIFLLAFHWVWKFKRDRSFLITSRNEDLVDKTGDSDCLFWKLDFIDENLPSWLKTKGLYRIDMHIENKENKCTIDGVAATGEIARGGRRTAVLIDEFASFKINDGYKVLMATRDATECRFFNSTPKGAGNAFYDATKLKDIRKLRMHWTAHPLKRAGLYKREENKPVELLDKGYVYPKGYEFIDDGKIRSKWYDREEGRCVNKVEIAQELDIEYSGSDYQFFDSRTIDKLISESIPPVLHGNVLYDPITHQCSGFDENKRGNFWMWEKLDGAEKPNAIERGYIIGADIASGTGASNSVLSIVKAFNGEKVAEYANPNLLPSEFATLAFVLANWFRAKDGESAFLIWEANGPGREFGRRITDLGYRKVYFRKKEDEIGTSRSSFPGWWSNGNTKAALLGEYRRALKCGMFINRSKEALTECLYYIQGTADIYHSASRNDIDPTGARDNHGDRVIADAVACWQISRTIGREALPEPGKEREIPYGSYAWRRERAEKAKREKEYYL